jgi:hypothetical protein
MNHYTSKSQRIKHFIYKRCQISPPVETDPRLLDSGVNSSIVACVALVHALQDFLVQSIFQASVLVQY